MFGHSNTFKGSNFVICCFCQVSLMVAFFLVDFKNFELSAYYFGNLKQKVLKGLWKVYFREQLLLLGPPGLC